MENNQNQNQTNDSSSLSVSADVLKGKSKLVCFLLGIFIGLAVILPGISGSTIAIILGMYTAMLYAMGHLLSKEFKRCFFFLLPLVLGAVLGFLSGFLIVQRVFGPYVFEMVCLFTGLMAGAFPALLTEIKGAPVTKKRASLFFAGVLVPVLIALLSFFLLPKGESTATFTEFPFWRNVAYLPLGALVSLTQIVPGLSATAVLMAFGQFGPILNSVHADYIFNNPAVLLLYAALGIGFFGGILLLSRLLSDLLSRHKTTSFFAIVGLSLGSILSMFWGTDMMECYARFGAAEAFPWVTVLLGVGLFLLGFGASYALLLYEKRHGLAGEK